MSEALNIDYLNEFAKQTGGQLLFAELTTVSVCDAIEEIFKTMPSNKGKYINTLDIGSENILGEISLDDVFLPANSLVEYQVRYSTDNRNWTDWTAWMDSSAVISFTEDLANKYRYVQYKIQVFGNESFQSPILGEGLTVCYLAKEELVVFFNPEDLDIEADDYISSLHLTHDASVPDTSEVKYGICQCESVDPEDYYNEQRPLINSDQQSILLSRSNEPMSSDNSRDYVAEYGRWPSSFAIRVYRNETLIDPSEYVEDSSNGTITFYDDQPDSDEIVLFIDFDSVYRITLNSVNYGTETSIISNIELMYNITKKINLP